MSSEKWLEAELRRRVASLGGLTLKFVSPGWSGAPDRLVITPVGRTVFVELKSTGKRLRPLQEKRKRQLEQFGLDVYVVATELSLNRFLEEVF